MYYVIVVRRKLKYASDVLRTYKIKKIISNR